MTNAEMYAIEIDNTPVLLQSAFAPSGELLLQIAVEPTDGAGTGSHSQQRLCHARVLCNDILHNRSATNTVTVSIRHPISLPTKWLRAPL